MDMEMDSGMEMELALAHELVFAAVRRVLQCLDFSPQDTLAQIGLSSPEARHDFTMVLAQFVREAGFEIDPADIPHDADDTPIVIASLLPGKSTKRNPH